jgi:outer membrane receptor protein involved in Fe transport
MLRTLLPLLLLCSALSAQTVTGGIEGHATDKSGASVPGARITVRNEETGLQRSTLSGAKGYFQLTFLPTGPYEIKAEAAGFARTLRNATVELNVTRLVDFTLEPASVAAEITVTEEAPLIETNRGELKSTIDQRTIEDRAVSSRNILSLVEQLPGFQTSGGASGVNNPTLSSGSYVSFNGTGSRSVAFQIDGVNNDDSSEGSNRQNVNLSAIKEFQVLSNAYSAEFGRAGGAVVLVQTKSGSNRFHGDLYEFFQNDKLNSNSFYNNAAGRKADGSLVAPRPAYRRNQYGGTIGGPIVRNKLFFFASAEQTKHAQYTTFTRYLIPATRVQVGECRLCLRPEEHPNLEADRQFLQNLLDKLPRAQPNNPAACDRCYTEQRPAYFPDSDYSTRLDYNPTQRDAITVRYQYSRQRRRPLPLIEGETAFQNNKQQNAGLTHTHMFGPQTWGEFRFGLGLRTTLVDIAGGNQIPIVRIDNPSPFTITTMGSAGAFPINRFQTDFQYVYNLSMVRGRHIIRTGIDYRRSRLDDFADNFSRGWYRFSATGVLGTANRYEGWENFLRGFMVGYERGYGNLFTRNRLAEYNHYVMDDIKLRPNLTINVGYRWEVVAAPREADNRINYGYADFYGGHQPRFGFAWTLNKRTVLRGGYGFFHNRIFQSVFSQSGASLRSLPPYGVYRVFESTFNVSDPTNSFVYDPGSFNAGQIAYARVDSGLRMPSVQQANFTIERQLGANMGLTISYQRVRGIGLLQNQIVNRARFPFTSPQNGVLYDKVSEDLGVTNPPAGFISQAQPRTNLRRPDPRYANITYITNSSWSYANNLRVELKRRYAKGLHFTAGYTLGKTMDTGSDVTAGSPLTEFDGPASLRALSDFHQTHRFVFNGAWRMPWFARAKGWKQQVLAGWTLSSTITLASGNPFTVTAGYDVNADGVLNDRPILLDASLFGRSVDDGRRNDQLPISGFFPNVNIRQQQRVFDPGGTGKGTLGRNTFFGDGIANFDAGLFKAFRVKEGHNLTLRAEMYALTNSPRFAFPVTNVNNQSFGRITSTFNPLNYVGAYRTDGANRLVQVALRYTF